MNLLFQFGMRTKELEMGFDRKTEGLTFRQRRRLQERESWKRYWEIREKESRGTISDRFAYYVHYYASLPATFFREKIVEPLNDRFQPVYYHRKLDRVPDIDQCGVHDRVCIFEANEQYRFDKLVDSNIVMLLHFRAQECKDFFGPTKLHMCAKYFDDYEEADLNFFIKYGEIGSSSDVVDAYMKQKHRLIWERRHPQIMAERKRVYDEHKKAMAEGKYELKFWNKFALYDKKYEYHGGTFFGHHWNNTKLPFEGDQPISKDWRYYKKLSEDKDFDKRNYPIWLNEAVEKAKILEEEAKNKKAV
ncbi:hypothetical protein Mgra_00003580 [Meloidogyne graminicola]|uniref:NADH dehydrogenase [ubiquinone] 1 beta subcomplex subunit 10 n=1 Tax=Meloidogyne graminicola TaxID=189291 RepID=A0A8S9ZVJ5_9BILA|nr:hypothetical protein Mgra_00003580 [Meloidogyne graminicola]